MGIIDFFENLKYIRSTKMGFLWKIKGIKLSDY